MSDVGRKISENYWKYAYVFIFWGRGIPSPINDNDNDDRWLLFLKPRMADKVKNR